MKDYTLTKKEDKNFPDGLWKLTCDYGSANIFAKPKKDGTTNYRGLVYGPDGLWVTERDSLDLNKLAEQICEELATTGLDEAVERAKKMTTEIAEQIEFLRKNHEAANKKFMRLLELRIRRDAAANK